MSKKLISQRLYVKTVLTGDINLIKLLPLDIYRIFQSAFLYIGLTKRLIVNIHLVLKSEISQLNGKYRNKWNPTNILSFNSKSDFNKRIMLGDLVTSPEFIIEESDILKKDLKFHWSHIMLHGFLHLLGYDHEDEVSASIMETLEKNILKSAGFKELPYE